MIDQTSTYDLPAVWAPLLVEWAEGAVARLTAGARVQAQHGFPGNAEAYLDVAQQYSEIARRARARLNDEPPATLPGLTDWVRGHLGRWFPGLPSQGWQAVAYVLHVWRPQ